MIRRVAYRCASSGRNIYDVERQRWVPALEKKNEATVKNEATNKNEATVKNDKHLDYIYFIP